MYQEDKTWFSQSLMFHRDLLFNTNSSLDLSIYSSTSDFRSYSPVNLKITIIDGNTKQSRYISMSYSFSSELIACLKNGTEEISKKLLSNKVVVQKKSYDKTLCFEFSRLSNQIICTIQILQNGDVGMIIIPYSVFNSIALLIRSYISDFIKLNLDFINRAVLIDILEQSKTSVNLLKTLPSSIERHVPLPVPGSPGASTPDELVLGTEKIEEETNDFDNFLNENISSTIIPEIEKLNESIELTSNTKTISKASYEINSDFIFNVLDGDLSKLEPLISSSITNDNTIQAFLNSLLQKMKVEDDFEFLPGIKESDYKSLVLVSKCLYMNMFHKYINFDIQIPSSIPILKYKVEGKVNESNRNLALDLFLISIYVRCLRSKLSSREQDSTRNKSVFYLGLRVFTDPLSMGIIENMDFNVIKSCIIDRFRYYQEKGVFNKYNDLLSSYNLSSISENEFSSALSNIGEKVIGKTSFIEDLHNKMFNERFIRVPYNNKLNLEQIIGECIPLQVNIFNKVSNIQDDDEVRKIITSLKDGISKEVLNEFKGTTTGILKKERSNSISRAANYYKSDIPERFRDKFISTLNQLTGQFDFNAYQFPIEEIGEGMLKALYVWNEGGMNDTYSDFMVKVEECPMDKTLILAKYKSRNEVSTEDWGDISWD